MRLYTHLISFCTKRLLLKYRAFTVQQKLLTKEQLGPKLTTMAYVPETVRELTKFNIIGASGKSVWSVLVSISWVILISLLLLKSFVYQQVTVIGESMEPSYQTNQLLLVDQINKNFNRGQVVAVYEDKEVAKTADYWTRFQTRFF